MHVRNVSVLTLQCILCQEQRSQDGGGEAGKAKSQGLCAGVVFVWSCPLEWWDQLPLQLQEQLEEQSPGFGSTQGTDVAGRGVGMRSNTPRVAPRVSVLTLEQNPWQSSHPHHTDNSSSALKSSLGIKLGRIPGVVIFLPGNAVGCRVVMPIQGLSCF